jgi:addiction module HigA family antidote
MAERTLSQMPRARWARTGRPFTTFGKRGPVHTWRLGGGTGLTGLAGKMGLHVQVVNGVVQGRRAVTAKTALLLAKAFDTTPQFWLNLQNACDLWEAQRELGGKRRAASR